MINAQNIGNKIKMLRMQRHVSQERMAEDLGMYQADISNLERAASGSGIADVFKLDMIADYFGIPLVELLNANEEDAVVIETEEQGAVTQPVAVAKEKTLAPANDTIPVAEPDDILTVDYSDLATVYRYRLMIETSLKIPTIYDELNDYGRPAKAILNKLKAACKSEEAYKVWKKDLVDAKMKEVMEKQNIIVCEYFVIPSSNYEEIMPEEYLEDFKKWVHSNGSAFFVGWSPATKRQIRKYVSQHIADELLGCPKMLP